VDSSEKPANVIAFCAGYGGIERGLELAGVNHRVVAYVEIEAFAIANLVSKMETGALGPAPIWSDLKTFPAHLFRDRVGLITGGYPCQPFSAAGKRKGADDPRHLWPHIRRHVQTIRPFRCFFENVEGHISLGLREVIADLEADSYKATWGIFSAAEVGAPHRRKRVFIMADAHPRLIDEPLEKICSRRHPASSRSSNVADSESKRCEEGGQLRPREPEKRSSGCGSDVADASSKGSPREQRAQPEGRGAGFADSGEKKTGASGSVSWSVEPKLGRVAHGVADRVDRLRLLGNGVVPQQAAKAWTVLSEQINEKDDD